VITIHQRYRQTDGQTDDMRSQYRALHKSASRGNKQNQCPFDSVLHFTNGDYEMSYSVFCLELCKPLSCHGLRLSVLNKETTYLAYLLYSTEMTYSYSHDVKTRSLRGPAIRTEITENRKIIVKTNALPAVCHMPLVWWLTFFRKM